MLLHFYHVCIFEKKEKNLEGPLSVADRKKMKKQKHRQVETGAKLNTYEKASQCLSRGIRNYSSLFPSPRSLLYNVNSFGNQAGACLHVRSVPGMH